MFVVWAVHGGVCSHSRLQWTKEKRDPSITGPVPKVTSSAFRQYARS